MTTSTFDESQLKAARVAGFLYLLTFAIVVAVNFGINERLMVAGNPGQTARNILAHKRFFRIGIASEASAKRAFDGISKFGPSCLGFSRRAQLLKHPFTSKIVHERP